MRRAGVTRVLRACASVGILTALTSVLVGCGGPSGSPQATAAGFVAAWDKGGWAAMSQLIDHPAPGWVTAAPTITAGLNATSATHTVTAVSRKGSDATATIASRYVLAGGKVWNIQSDVAIDDRGGHWLVEWSPAAIDPGLRSGERLVATTTWAPRAEILGAAGAPLTAETSTVTVGIEGSRVKDAATVSATLIAAGATPAEVTAAQSAAAADPTYFEPVFEMTQARFQQLGGTTSALYTIPGTVFEQSTARTPVTAGLAAHVVGTVGPITKEELQQLGPSYTTSSVVGQSGLEAAYQSQLAGTPGTTVAIVGSNGASRATAATFPPVPGTPLRTSIDPTVQRATEAALATVAGVSSLVAIRASTGEVLAAVSDPASYQFDEALEGEFPPGSTFKVVTASALMEAGLSPSSPASCPSTLTVDGEVFHNAEGDAPVSDMAQAFAESCNTAFIGLASAHLQPNSFPAVASQFGIGSSPKLGLAAFGGSVPVPADGAALAATAIGQAKVVVSPLDMAMAAAAVDTGEVRAPRLVSGAPDDSQPARPLSPAVTEGLRQMMAAVVASGTASGTGLPAGTYAKTGTAQYGSGTPQPTDAWLMGYQGDVAFAVVVQGTGNGGPTDGPVIARFLDSLATGG